MGLAVHDGRFNRRYATGAETLLSHHGISDSNGDCLIKLEANYPQNHTAHHENCEVAYLVEEVCGIRAVARETWE
jgi:hypothetical protein